MTNDNNNLLLIINDYLSARIILETGILSELESGIPNRLIVLLNENQLDVDNITRKYSNIKFLSIDKYSESNGLSLFDKLLAYADYWMDQKFGFFPLSLRFNIRKGFQKGRRTYGNKNAFLDLNRIGPLPLWDICYSMMYKWYFSKRLRFIHPEFKTLCVEENISAIFVSNAQHPQNAPFFIAAGKLGIPMMSYIASWDHPVGKGPLYPQSELYLVQNEVSKKNLKKYHGIDDRKISVTGWPQMDLYGRDHKIEEYNNLLKSFGLTSDRPVALLAGCTVNNAPFEPIQLQNIVDWRDANGGVDRFSIIFRPHPKDHKWKDRYHALLGRENVYIQEQTFSRMDELALLLGNVSCVVCTAGTILLDSVANDRPIVALAYDEDDSMGGSHTFKNYINEHYKEIMEFKPFYLAKNFDDVIMGINKAINDPNDLSEARENVKQELLGIIDGKAAKRVANAVIERYGDSLQ